VRAREILARALLAASGLPRLPESARPDRRAWPTQLRDPAEGPTPAPRPLVPYLQHLAETRPVVFHGSRQGGLAELSDARHSRDRSAYGDQTAVFASQDPLWAMFFALLRRDVVASTRNASIGADTGVRGRRYLFSVRPSERSTAVPLAPGALYVLPDDGFVHERRRGGLFDTAHRTHAGAVRPLAWFEVRVEDFPFAGYLGRHSDEESMARTLWNARRRVRGARP
jgi:hypothetical protein